MPLVTDGRLNAFLGATKFLIGLAAKPFINLSRLLQGHKLYFFCHFLLFF